MTIKPGEPWGRSVPRPSDLLVANSDADLAATLSQQHERPVAVAAGDLARTLGVIAGGSEPIGARQTFHEYPIDLLEVRLDGAEEPLVACAHVVARSPWSRAQWLRGQILAVMNAEFIGGWDVAPRGHPNDGRAEVFDVDASMSVRDRFAARRRLLTGTHVPHPRIATRSVRTGSWTFERPLDVIVDGHVVGRASTLALAVVPDAAIVHA